MHSKTPTFDLCLFVSLQGETVLDNLLDSDDVTFMIGALRALGVAVEQPEGSKKRVVVKGCAGRFPAGQAESAASGQVDLFLGNAGTAMRPLTAAVAVAGGNAT